MTVYSREQIGIASKYNGLNFTNRRGGFAKLGMQPHAVRIVTGGFRTCRSSGCHFTPQFRKTAC